MVAAVDAVALLGLVFVNGSLAALLSRFFRVQMVTDWGSLLYTVLIVPVVQFVVLLVISGVFMLGPNVGSPAMVIGVAIVVPLAVGVAFDYFWMPAPEEVDLPDQHAQERRRSL